jgi:hypothetical protein
MNTSLQEHRDDHFVVGLLAGRFVGAGLDRSRYEPGPTRRGPAFIVLSRVDIAARAYEMYLERGASDGFDREDWLRAEQELKARGQDAYRRRHAVR